MSEEIKKKLHKKLLINEEIEKAFQDLFSQIEEEIIPIEKKNINCWYCGVTGQLVSNTEFELKRIVEHHNENYPKLDSSSICKVKVSSSDVAIAIEKRMGNSIWIDDGKKSIPPTEDNQVWVYAFRKEIGKS